MFVAHELTMDSLGVAVDRAVFHRVATATSQALLGCIADVLLSPASRAGSSTGAAPPAGWRRT